MDHAKSSAQSSSVHAHVGMADPCKACFKPQLPILTLTALSFQDSTYHYVS